MPIFYVQVDVHFKTPLDLNKGRRWIKGRIKGFVQEIGCTATSDDEMKASVITRILDTQERTNSEVHFERVGIINTRDIEKEVYGDPDISSGLLNDPTANGIWYLSGRAFYEE